MKSLDITTVKARLPEVMRNVEIKEESYIITRHRKRVGVILSLPEYKKMLQNSDRKEKKGIILAKGSLSDIPSKKIDDFIENIYNARKNSKERSIKI